MNRKQLVVLLVLACVIGGTWLWMRQRNSDAWEGGEKGIGQKLLPNLAVNAVAQITIKTGTNELNLARRENLWRVRERNDYPANFSRISELLLKLADLKVAQTEEVGPSQLARFALVSPGPVTNTGTLVELKDTNGKTLHTLLLGKRHIRKPGAESPIEGAGWPDGRYVQAGGGKNVAVISDTLDSVQCQPQQWLNKEFFSIDKPRTVALQFHDATNSWKLVRASETNDWQLDRAKPGEALDSSKISGVTSLFRSPGFNDVLPRVAQPEVSGPADANGLTVETFDGFTYAARIEPKRDGDYPLTLSVTADLPAARTPAENEKAQDKSKLDTAFQERRKKLADKLARERQFANWIYLVPPSTVDPFLKAKSQLLVEPKTSGTNAPAAK
jgi:hypothetical protein